jgi:hypothetical protein
MALVRGKASMNPPAAITQALRPGRGIRLRFGLAKGKREKGKGKPAEAFGLAGRFKILAA